MMKKQDHYALAEAGARQVVAKLERELAHWHHEFPAIFIGNERPHILKAELRENSSNGAGETKRAAAAKAAWTPERRAKASKMQRERRAVERGRKKGKKKLKLKKMMWSERWYARLKKHGPERVSISATALGTKSATLLTSGVAYLKDGVIKKQSMGVYAVGPTPPPE